MSIAPPAQEAGKGLPALLAPCRKMTAIAVVQELTGARGACGIGQIFGQPGRLGVDLLRALILAWQDPICARESG